ncbi:MAG: glycoside hydrolase family 25 protein [Dysgonomonas sp.]
MLSAFIFFSKYKNNISNEFDRQEFTVKGVDLSHHNPIIDWATVSDQDISFVYLKATGGVKHLDRNYPYNYKSAKSNNLRTGSYHFYLFGVSGRKQARHFINTAKVETGDLIPAIDIEHSGDNPYSKDSTYNNLVIAELKNLENALYEYYGVRPILYTNRECYKLYVQNNFSENYIWLCDLKNKPSDINNWIIWQFSHTGKLGEVKENIDLNYFRYSHDQLNKILMP